MLGIFTVAKAIYWDTNGLARPEVGKMIMMVFLIAVYYIGSWTLVFSNLNIYSNF